MTRPTAVRFGRHLITDHWSARRAFPPAALRRIEEAIKVGEARHTGQVRFVIEAALHLSQILRGQTPRERALDVFGRLRVWDTEENCGVLIYVLLADKDVEIVADRGIHRRVGDDAWKSICRAMESAFRNRRFEEGAITGIERVCALLAEHFPRTAPGPNELPDRPLVL